MKSIRSTTLNIGLMGAHINNPNLGCVALTYSTLALLDDISQKIGVFFQYFIFEGATDSIKNTELCRKLNIKDSFLHAMTIDYIYRLRSMLHHPKRAYAVIKAIDKCDLFIDLTAGDSFTDIYGEKRFSVNSKNKELVLKKRKPLVLGPQTYGPFNNKQNELRAKSVIEKATRVIARDQASADYIASFSDAQVDVTTDLAFRLPFEPQAHEGDRIKVGVNISSLLIKNKLEPTQTEFELSSDYDEFIRGVLRELQSRNYEIHVIPHVSRDGGEVFRDEFPDLIYHTEFSSPIDAKNCIAGMDVFIGARMHATIAAFSSRVATIPTAYSRKFTGLYDNLGYPYVVDLTNLKTEEAIKKTLDYVTQYEQLKNCTVKCMHEVEAKSKLTQDILTEMIQALL